MNIRLINCDHVHIFDETTFVYAADGIYELDSVSTRLISILKSDSSFDYVVSQTEKQMELDYHSARELVEDIIQANHRFLTISSNPNIVKITGRFEARFPSMLQISLTSRCVHQCKHCFKKCNIVQGNDFPFDSLVGLLNQIKGESSFVEFTGGEPLLYPHIMDIVRLFRNQFHMHITTSGYALHTFSLSDLENFELIQISLHGSAPTIHDSFVGRRGSFCMVTNNIRWLCRNGVNIVVSRCIQSYDANELNDFIKLCIDLGVRHVIFGIILPVGRAVQTGCITANSEYAKITTFLKSAQEYYPQIDIVLDEDHALSKQCSKYVFHCIGGRAHLYVDENGSVFPCPYCQEESLSMGNIIIKPDTVNRIIYQSQYDVFNNELISRPLSQLKNICPNIREPDL